MFNSGSSQFYYSSSGGGGNNSGGSTQSYGGSRFSFGGNDEQFSSSQVTNATKPRRPSVSGMTTMDDFARPRRTSVGGGLAAQTQLDPPCRPATISMLYKYRDSETGIVKLHGSPDSGPVHLIGWGYLKDSRVCSGESEFQFSDGTGRIVVRVDIPTEDESWLLPRIKQLVLRHSDVDGANMDEENNPSGKENCQDDVDRGTQFPLVCHYLRLVATVTQDMEDQKIVVRAIHLRDANPSEAAYHHSIECSLVKLQLDEGLSSSSTKGLDANVATSLLEDVVLPESYDNIEDRDQQLILKYITKYRKELCGGVQIEHMQSYLKQVMDKSKFEASMQFLEDHDRVIKSSDVTVDTVE